MLAKDVMTKEVVTATPHMSVEALTRLLLDEGVSAVPVIGAGGEVLDGHVRRVLLPPCIDCGEGYNQ